MECLSTRTSALYTFRSLGAPDLVQLTKTTKTKESSTYHYTTGIDVSSSAAIAAHLNTLTFTLGESQVWFGRTPGWKIAAGTYCSYNAFSKLDIRVNAKIPGSVEAVALDLRGEEHKVADHHWREVYMSAMMRAMLLKDSDQYFVASCRHENPLSSPREAAQFFDAFEQLFLAGPQVGASYLVQSPSLECNFMVDTFLKVLEVTGEFKLAEQCLERLAKYHSAAKTLLAKVLIMSEKEIDAVKTMVAGVKSDPRDAQMLALEAEFCLKKGRLDLAHDSGLRSVAAAPVEFFSWDVLTQVYIAEENYEQALLTLNSAPLQQSAPMDTIRMPLAKKIHSPLPTDGVIDEVWAVDSNDDSETADASLLRLPASGLKGSALRAFDLLGMIFQKVGWPGLMRYRGEVFLMETEANAKSKETTPDTKTINPDETQPKETDNGSTGETVSNGNGHLESTEAPTARKMSTTASRNIKSKRLCERRLDSLFMVLYEDVRAYSDWQRELVHRESQQLPFNKTSLEWEVFGSVAQRLGHEPQAIQAFQKSLEMRFSHRVAWKLLEHYYKVRDYTKALELIVKLTAWNHRWYIEFSPRLSELFRGIVAREGLTKVQSIVNAAFSRTGALVLTEKLLADIKAFKSPGTEL